MNLEVSSTFGKGCTSQRFLKIRFIFPKKFLKIKIPGRAIKCKLLFVNLVAGRGELGG